MLDPKNCKPGQEQHETFTYKTRGNDIQKVQYDYRTSDGQLFSCIANTLEEARARKDSFVKKLVR